MRSRAFKGLRALVMALAPPRAREKARTRAELEASLGPRLTFRASGGPRPYHHRPYGF